MFAKLPVCVAVFGIMPILGHSVAWGQIIIPTVNIGSPGNAADPLVMNDGTSGYGAVGYAYQIGTTEVTNAQYAAFLNAVAASDPNDLYNPSMAGAFGGIVRSGTPGSYVYTTISGRANHPVNFVSFWDACRFANWLHNCQPLGPQNSITTEDGAYAIPAGGGLPGDRNANWRWAVPTENEWYKAAHHQPFSQGGDADNFWLFPTSSNTQPTEAQANYSNNLPDATPVGTYPANFYGTRDMAGNVAEWTEARGVGGSSDARYHRGGSFRLGDVRADLRYGPVAANQETNHVGIRVVRSASPPSPSCLGDVNGDCAVNTVDLVAFLAVFGQAVPVNSAFDLFGDGVVNTLDLTIFLSFFGTRCGQ
ncbi:MAG: SUMF1/EgtB/PvdO family nonheme iron enzyme [Phycisphaerales bacterium]